MNFIALKTLLGDRAKYIGIIIGLTFASFLVMHPLHLRTAAFPQLGLYPGHRTDRRSSRRKKRGVFHKQ